MMIRIKRLDHIQICIPVGEEKKAREYYGHMLGLKEIPKPESLITNGGLWFEVGDIQLHIGVESTASRSKRHPAFEVDNISQVRSYLEQKGVAIQEEKPIPYVTRFSFFDPFGNRIEFLEKETPQHKESASTKKAVQSQFGRSAEAYIHSTIHAKGNDLKKLVDISGARSSDCVLDVATGGGHVANALAPLVSQVTALDLTPEILVQAEKFIRQNGHENVEMVQGDAEQMPFSDESYDIVTCRIAPHHFPNITSFISEVRRVLKPGGQFLLVDNVAPEDDELDRFYNEVEKRRDYSHHRAWKKSEWLQMLENERLVVEEWHRFSKTFEFDDWCDRMQLAAEEKKALASFLGSSSAKAHEVLRIKKENGNVLSFDGESILLKAIKPM
jgi:ubiquinone/menaquinone biosynthesis C-methylase UbiE/catechol 2,3-dioxygenase-like lactoylglutathione lyase family enzyme